MINRNAILKVIFAVIMVIGVALFIPCIVSFIYKEPNSGICFLACSAISLFVGFIGINIVPKATNTSLRMRDGFFIVGIAWILFSAIGALPFTISGSIPSYVDAFYETASGFSTTGSTILRDVEALPKGMLFWRSFTHWLGGMGVLVLTIAILPMLGIGGQKIMRAETTGPTMDKITFTVTGSAKRLYIIYTGFTALEVVFLKLGGMDLFDALVHSFGTLGTGGLSIYNSSIAYYGNFYFEMVIAVFMILAGINFSLYYYLFTGNAKQMFKDPEFKAYIWIIVIATAFLMGMLLLTKYYTNIVDAFRYSIFQVSSIITTTGYGTADFDLWPLPCKMVILCLMFIGGCAGSTGGGLKVIRFMMAAKLIKRSIEKHFHKNSVSPIRIGGKKVDESVLYNVKMLLLIYAVITLASTFLVSLDGVDLTTAFSAVVACFSNIGPGFNLVGPSQNFALFSPAIKILLSLLMIAGRLEIYTIAILFTPKFWSKE